MPINETTRRTLEQIVVECNRYPLEAFEFVRHGLNHAVVNIHGEVKSQRPDQQCHISGQQLCLGLRAYAIERYGVMAKAVLNHWGITRTVDFGRIVFAMVDGKLMQKTDDDDIHDFENVFDFETSFLPPPRPNPKNAAIFQV
jgi:uncharacterized repeat protein (TIGR04138 family)